MSDPADEEASADEVSGKRRPQPEDLPVVIALVAEQAISLRKACRRLGLHPGHTVTALQSDNDLWAQYARARESRGEHFADKVVGVADKVMAGKVAPDVGRVAMDGYKWAAGRMAPKSFGDRVALEHTGKDGVALPAAPAPVTFVAVYPSKRDPE